MKVCQFVVHSFVAVYLLITACFQHCLAQDHVLIGRKPANFIPDDDMIVVPLTIEKNFIDEVNEENKATFDAHRKTVQMWIQNEEYAEMYGLENRGVFQTSTPAQRQRFFERNYLRFINKKAENNTNEGITNWWEKWTADDELESINNVEKNEEYLVKAKKNKGRPNLDQKETVKVGKQEVEVGFQPRLELGMLKVTVDSPYVNVRAWVGVNGNQEVKFEKRINSTNTKAVVNYFIDQERVLAAVDQGLSDNWSLRLTHDKNLKDSESLMESGISENNIMQLRFGMGF
jgi:hypothetical protein